MGTIVRLEDIIEHLNQRGWNPKAIGEDALSAGFDGKNVRFRVLAILHHAPELNLLFVHTEFPFKVPENKRKDICELLAHMNYGKVLGCCEMELLEGSLSYRTAIPEQLCAKPKRIGNFAACL